MDMGKYVAVGVLAVIVLAAVTYEAPNKNLRKRGQAGAQQLEGSFGQAATPERSPQEPEVPALPPARPEELASPQKVAAPEPPPTKVEQLTEYTVKAGQTLCDIAEETLGDRGRWKELYEQNRDRLPNPDTLRAGMRIVFKAAHTASAEIAQVSTTPSTQPATPSREHTPGRSYTVTKGDTLYSIAKRELGKGARWREISSLNGLPSEHLSEGAILRLPN